MSPEGNFADRRQWQRTAARAPARLALMGGAVWRGEATSVNFGGALFLSDERDADPEPGTHGVIEIALAGPHEAPAIIECQVVRVLDAGLGLRFLSTDMDGFNLITHFMMVHGPDPRQVMDEVRVNPALKIITSTGDALE